MRNATNRYTLNYINKSIKNIIRQNTTINYISTVYHSKNCYLEIK